MASEAIVTQYFSIWIRSIARRLHCVTTTLVYDCIILVRLCQVVRRTPTFFLLQILHASKEIIFLKGNCGWIIQHASTEVVYASHKYYEWSGFLFHGLNISSLTLVTISTIVGLSDKCFPLRINKIYPCTGSQHYTEPNTLTMYPRRIV